MLVGELHVDAEALPNDGELRVPTTRSPPRWPTSGPNARTAERSDVAYEMEVVSDYWRGGTDPKQRSQNKTVEALLARQAAGRSMSERSPTRALRLAV